MKKLLIIVLIAVLGMTACGPTPEELVEQGKNHIENENYTEAMACFQKAAEKGNAEAEYNIANLYGDGLGVEADIETSAEWLKKSAEKDYPEAQNTLAVMYYGGVGVPQDYEKAAKWAKKAAAYDMTDAQFVLANLYANGRGVPQDFNKAAELLLKVEKKGGDYAKKAQSVLFVMYLEGLGVPQSDDKAVEMLRKAGGITKAEAQFGIGELYNKGNTDLNIKPDVDKTVKWFRRAAENGHAQAQNYMGTIYYQGVGVTKSVKDAKYWWQKAADQGNEDAKEALRSVAKVEKDGKVKAKKDAQYKAMKSNKVYTINGVSFEMINVIGSTYTMGGTSEQGNDVCNNETAHDVTLSDYYIGKFEVTQELWSAVMGSNPSYFKGEQQPVEMVNWNDVQEFITKINQKLGTKFRLPTEAEWEYAARGGVISKGYKYSGSNNIKEVAWHASSKKDGPKQVGKKAPNELGIYDMSGNVSEWCQDWYAANNIGNKINPKGPSSGSTRICRGGSWITVSTACRVSDRMMYKPDYKCDGIGFRLAMSY